MAEFFQSIGNSKFLNLIRENTTSYKRTIYKQDLKQKTSLKKYKKQTIDKTRQTSGININLNKWLVSPDTRKANLNNSTISYDDSILGI